MKHRRPDLALAALFAASLSACVGTVSNPGANGSSSGSGGAVTGSGGAGNAPGSGGNGGPDGGNSGSGGDQGTAGTGQAGMLDLSGSPSYYRFVRITNAQWARSVQDILKLSAPSGLEANFQSAVAGTTDFSNNELVLDVTQQSWGDFETAAETLAAQVTASDAALSAVYAGTDAAGFIASFGRRAYRRPLTAAETSAYMTLFTSGTSLTRAGSAFAKGASLVIRAMLQSPNFLYRSEMGANGSPLSAYEMATKLSLWLRGTTPSDTLLDAAAGPGKLDTADGAVALATTMLGEPTATAVMRQFHGELLHFDRYQTISKLNVPTYTASLNAEYEESSYLFFDNIFTQGLGVKDILTSNMGFVGPGMAKLYEGNVAAPASGYAQRALGNRRVGYFLQLPFLTLYGRNADPDSIHRGVSMNLDVLCAPLGPPATVIPPIPPLMAGQTNRQNITTLTAGCGGTCHNAQINPLGFAFDHYDGMGQYRDTENGGVTIDSSGTYAFSSGTKSFTGASDLMQIMSTEPLVHQCYAKKMASFALQRDLVAADQPLLTALATTSMGGSGSVKQVMLDLVKNNAFRTRVGGTP